MWPTDEKTVKLFGHAHDGDPQAAVLFLTAFPMVVLRPDYGPLPFGIFSAACFFFPAQKYYRQRRRLGTTTIYLATASQYQHL